MCQVGTDERQLISKAVSISSGSTSRTVFHFLGDTKVRDLDTTFIIDEHVSTLDITMDDIPLVKVIQPEKDLSDPVRNERFLEGAVVP